MQENNKRIAKNTMMLYFRMLFSMGVGLYTSRVVLEVLGVEDFGIYTVVGGLVVMFSLLNRSLSSAIQRYLTFELGAGNKDKLRETFSTSLNILFIISLLIIILAQTVGLWFLNTMMDIPDGRMNVANLVFQISLITFVLSVISVPYNAAITAHENFKVYSQISIFEVVLKLVVVLSLKISMSADKLIIYAFMLLGVALIIRLIYGFYCTKHYEECRYLRKIDIPLVKDMLSFSAWNFIGGSAFLLKTQGLNILLNMFFGVVINAAQGIAAQVQTVVSSFVSNFITVVNPQITKLYASKDFESMNKLVFYSSRLSFFLMLIFTAPIFMETEFILNLWLRQVPQYAVVFTQLMLISISIDMLSNPINTAVLATKKIALYQSVGGGITLLNIPVSFLFLKMGYSPYATIIISCVISVVALFARLIVTKNILPFSMGSYIKNVIMRIIIVSTSVTILLFLFKSFMALPAMFNIVIAFIVAILFIWLCGLRKNEKLLVTAYIHKKFVKNGVKS